MSAPGEARPPAPASLGPFWLDRNPSLLRRWTRRRRLLPDFLILGGQRCGTTSLHRQLERLPGLSLAPSKEVHFFDLQYHLGIDWYRAHFPLAFCKRFEQRFLRRALVTGESTPYYLFHPCAPERVRKVIPSARLIVLVRNPVDRAFSHYHHAIRWRLEDAPTFEEALAREEGRLEGEEARLLADGRYRSVSHCHHSYLARGVYVRQLRAWRSCFKEEQILVLRSEDLFADPGPVLERIQEFLGVPVRKPRGFPHLNKARNPEMSRELRDRLVSHFRPYNKELGDFLGFDPGWDV
ncbi:MAG: sulfotransferase domain-containing protein [Planctomycetota bacterium]